MNGQWAVVDTVHITPLEDLIEHELSPDCPCQPRETEAERAAGTVFWIFTHSSLDGRELHEPKPDPTEGAPPCR